MTKLGIKAQIQKIIFDDTPRAVIGVIMSAAAGWNEVRGWKQWAGFYDNLSLVDVWMAK